MRDERDAWRRRLAWAKLCDGIGWIALLAFVVYLWHHPGVPRRELVIGLCVFAVLGLTHAGAQWLRGEL